MEWTDDAVVLGARRQGETSLVVALLTRRHGRHSGLIRGGAKSRQRGLYEPGNTVIATWRARLQEHLGHLSLEPVAASAALFMDDPLRLACLEAATALVEAAVPQHVPHPALYDVLAALLDGLRRDEGWAGLHLRFELLLLAELGYGLDLGRCAVTGSDVDLAFVSPRTGRAVSRAAGAAWRERLLVLPLLLGGTGRDGPIVPAQDLADGLALTGHFIAAHLLLQHAAVLPAARTRYVDCVTRLVAISRGSPSSGQDS